MPPRPDRWRNMRVSTVSLFILRSRGSEGRGSPWPAARPTIALTAFRTTAARNKTLPPGTPVIIAAQAVALEQMAVATSPAANISAFFQGAASRFESMALTTERSEGRPQAASADGITQSE
jgi:hypothetical protein